MSIGYRHRGWLALHAFVCSGLSITLTAADQTLEATIVSEWQNIVLTRNEDRSDDSFHTSSLDYVGDRI
jgi:hypothetical protein